MAPWSPSPAAGGIATFHRDSISLGTAEANRPIVLHHGRDHDVITEGTGHMAAWEVARERARR
jgi:hypothetical protein